ncbi:MAG: hypothetical protein Q7S40_34255 [Opitutaceae bacterium]|nr:hypothetical protein [Opitutaceae bacterium]
MMPTPPTHKDFLLIDADADGRVLLARTLLRVFPRAAIVECQDLETAVNLLVTHEFDAVVSHRAIGADPEKLVRAIREQKRNVPLLAVAGNDRRKQLVLAGATMFLSSNEWIRVGTVVADMLAPQPAIATD